MTAIAITANILFAAVVLIAIVGSHLWSISSSRVPSPAVTAAPQRNNVRATKDFAHSAPADAVSVAA